MKIKLSELYVVFFKISIILIGGGYVILPVCMDEFTKKRNWLTKEEVIDFYTLSHCLPGINAIKTAIFIGYHLKGKSGALFSIMGLITPPFFAILFIAYFLQNHNFAVSSIMDFVSAAVIVLTISAFVELATVCLKNKFSIFLFLMTVFLFIFLKLPPVTLIIILFLIGVLMKYLFEFLRKGEE